MFYSPRRKFYEDVIPVPATATTSSAVIESDALYPFEQSAFGKATVFVKGDNSKMSVADASLTAKVSYDEGTTWIDAATTSVAHGSFEFTVASVAGIVPRAKLSLDLNGMTLAEDHGLSVDILFQESEEGLRRTIFTDVLGVDASVTNPATDLLISGDVLTVPEDAVSVTAIFTADASKLTGDLNARLKSSFDGENWWDLGAAVTEVSAESFKEISSADTDLIGKYVRFDLTVDATAGAIAENHGIKVNVISFDRN